MDTNQYLPFAIIGIVVLLALGAVAFAKAQARKRTAALRLVAQELGLTFIENATSTPKDFQTELALFNRGRSRRTTNLMIGKWAGLQVRVFDYSFVTGGGKSSHTWKQTVAAYATNLAFPLFEMRPEGLLDRIGDAFTHKDIDFDSHPDFSRRYLLRGNDPEKIRGLFSPALLTFCEELPQDAKWHIEGCGETIIFYRLDNTVGPQLLKDFLDQTARFAKSFANCAGA